MTKTGIYAITCLESRKIYVGKSKSIHMRWSRHRHDLNKGQGVNQHIQSAWIKYGEKAFVFSVLEECSPEQLDEREVYWMRHYDTTNNTNGYNILEEYSKTKGKEESNKKKRPERREWYSEPVVCIDVQTKEVAILDSFREVAEALNVSKNIVQQCLASWKKTSAKTKTWSVKGFILIYLSDFDNSKDYVEELGYLIVSKRGRRQTNTSILKHDKRKDQKGTPIRAINILTNEYRDFPTKKSMCRELNLLLTKVQSCLSAESSNKQHRGYKFETNLEIPIP